MTHPLFDLTGRVALVSGAAQGVGRAISLAFAEAGADLMLADLNEPGVQQTAADVEALGRRAVAVKCDVSDPGQIRAMFERLDNDFGRIDVLANVAGGSVVLGPPEELDLDDVTRSLQGLVVGRFCCCQEAGRRMLSAGTGSIINIASLAGLTALGRGHAAYSTAMGGVVQMTRELSTEWSSRGVRVNAISPGGVYNNQPEEFVQRVSNLIPMGRMANSDEYQGAILFLCSDASSYMTGFNLVIDGGRSCW